MQYVNPEKTATQCNLCGTVVQTIKTLLPNGNVKIEYGCPICGTQDHQIFQNPTVKIMEAKKQVDTKPDVQDISSNSTPGSVTPDKLSKKIGKALSRK